MPPRRAERAGASSYDLWAGEESGVGADGQTGTAGDAAPRPSAAGSAQAAAQLLGVRSGRTATQAGPVRPLYDDLLEGADGNRLMAEQLLDIAHDQALRRQSIERISARVGGYSVVGHLRASMVHLGAAIQAMEAGEEDLGRHHLRIADSHRARADRRNSVPGR